VRNCSRRTEPLCKKALFRKLQVLGFALYDTVLFLDTHPCDQGALDYYDKVSATYETTKKQYEDAFGPLTVKNVNTDHGWSWTASPWPWEYDCE